MNPIINPWIFYLIDLSNSLSRISVFLFVVSTVICIILSGILAFDDDCFINKKDKQKIVKYFKWVFITFCTSSLCLIFIPSKDTLYKMIVTSYITEDNVMKAVNIGKDFKQEIKKDILDIINNSITEYKNPKNN